MTTNILNEQLKKNLPEIRPGDTIVVYEKIKEKEKERIQAFEGLVLARKHGKGINSTITVRKIIGGFGVEKIYPLHSPSIEKIDVLRHSKTRRAKLYYIREKAVKEARKKLKQTVVKKQALEKGSETIMEEPEKIVEELAEMKNS